MRVSRLGWYYVLCRWFDGGVVDADEIGGGGWMVWVADGGIAYISIVGCWCMCGESVWIGTSAIGSVTYPL